LIGSLKDGNRPVVTATGECGQEQKLRIEAMPRYGNYNLLWNFFFCPAAG